MHTSRQVPLRHFLVDDPAARGHPLHVTGGNRSSIPHTVAMLDGPREHIGYGLNPAVGVPRESCQIVLGNVIAKVVEQQERVEIRCVAEAKGAAQMHSGAFESGFGSAEPLDRSYRHRWPPAASSYDDTFYRKSVTAREGLNLRQQGITPWTLHGCGEASAAREGRNSVGDSAQRHMAA